ncbi:MAG TPA: AAA family ATPase [Isosphaeraceae bacterium]|nr:AAA family ATPase [Isosphaeraceae bacterium]
MSKLTIIAGLPGSGKSHLVRELHESTSGSRVEDYMKESKDNSSRMVHSQHFEKLIEDLSKGLDCVIADIVFCEAARREEIESAVKEKVRDVEIEWVYFENDPVACAVNATRRNMEKLIKQIQRIDELSKKYDVPKDIGIKPVFKLDKH